jgi:hypothetical protein
MLNDLYILQRNLKQHGVDTVRRHPDIKDLAKGPAVRVLLGEDGAIAGFELIAEAGNGRVWTLRDGQHNGFPGLKTPAGFLDLTDDAEKLHKEAWKAAKDPAARRAELSRVMTSAPINSVKLSNWPSETHRRRVAERLESLRPLAAQPTTSAVPAVFERFLKGLTYNETFAARLFAALAERLGCGDETWLEPIRSCLTGAAQFIVDVPVDDDVYRRSAVDPRQIGPVSAALGAAPVDGRGRSGIVQ